MGSGILVRFLKLIENTVLKEVWNPPHPVALPHAKPRYLGTFNKKIAFSKKKILKSSALDFLLLIQET